MAPELFINRLSTWVCTDVLNYAKLSDIKDYMKERYPLHYDGDGDRVIQDFEIQVTLQLPMTSKRLWTQDLL